MASWAPVEAPDGTTAVPEPSPVRTVTLRVGLPRESRTSSALTFSIGTIGRSVYVFLGLPSPLAEEGPGTEGKPFPPPPAGEGQGEGGRPNLCLVRLRRRRTQPD